MTPLILLYYVGMRQLDAISRTILTVRLLFRNLQPFTQLRHDFINDVIQIHDCIHSAHVFQY